MLMLTHILSHFNGYGGAFLAMQAFTADFMVVASWPEPSLTGVEEDEPVKNITLCTPVHHV